MKTCLDCKETLPLHKFYKKGKYRQSYCVDCQRERSKGRTNFKKYTSEELRERHLRLTYGLSLEDYDKLLEKQENLCAICKKPNTSKRPFHVDHCHTTKKVRGLLCITCNTMLGRIETNPEILKNLNTYLSGDYDYSF